MPQGQPKKGLRRALKNLNLRDESSDASSEEDVRKIVNEEYGKPWTRKALIALRRKKEQLEEKKMQLDWDEENVEKAIASLEEGLGSDHEEEEEEAKDWEDFARKAYGDEEEFEKAEEVAQEVAAELEETEGGRRGGIKGSSEDEAEEECEWKKEEKRRRKSAKKNGMEEGRMEGPEKISSKRKRSEEEVRQPFASEEDEREVGEEDILTPVELEEEGEEEDSVGEEEEKRAEFKPGDEFQGVECEVPLLPRHLKWKPGPVQGTYVVTAKEGRGRHG